MDATLDTLVSGTSEGYVATFPLLRETALADVIKLSDGQELLHVHTSGDRFVGGCFYDASPPLCPVRAHRTIPPIDSMESTISKWIEIEEGVDAH